MTCYRVARQGECDRGKDTLALTYARKAAGALGIPAPHVVWLKESPGGAFCWDGPFRGMVKDSRPDTIYLALDCPASYLQGVVYHECRHLWQFHTARGGSDRQSNEADAERWTYTYTKYLGD